MWGWDQNNFCNPSWEHALPSHASLNLENKAYIWLWYLSELFQEGFFKGCFSIINATKYVLQKAGFHLHILKINPRNAMGLFFKPAQARLKDVRVVIHPMVITLNKFQDGLFYYIFINSCMSWDLIHSYSWVFELLLICISAQNPAIFFPFYFSIFCVKRKQAYRFLISKCWLNWWAVACS